MSADRPGQVEVDNLPTIPPMTQCEVVYTVSRPLHILDWLTQGTSRATGLHAPRALKRMVQLLIWLSLHLGIALPAAWAQEVSVEGAMGAGLFGSDAAATADVRADMRGGISWSPDTGYDVGLGARLRWIAGEGVRRQDWDQASEWVSLVRYLHVRHHGADETQLAFHLAAGPLGEVSIGHGALIRDYTGNLDVDHRTVGMHLRYRIGAWAGEAMIDDIVAPRLVGARGLWHRRRGSIAFEVGASAAADVAAPVSNPVSSTETPTMTEGDSLATERTFLPMMAGDASTTVYSMDDRLSATAYAEMAALSAAAGGVPAAGLHLGLRAQIVGRRPNRERTDEHAAKPVFVDNQTQTASFSEASASKGAPMADDDHLQVTTTAELAMGTSGYVAGWIGPLYLRDRYRAAGGTRTQLDLARAGAFSGRDGLVAIEAEHGDLGALRLAYAHRSGLSDLWLFRLSAPRAGRLSPGGIDLRGALWVAVETAAKSADSAPTLALELRAQLPHSWFVSADVSRLFQMRGDEINAIEPTMWESARWRHFWAATIAVGANMPL